MSRVMHGPLRGLLVGAARQLITEARAARGVLDVHDPERQFFLGVEAAAEEVVHPELTESRPAAWPDGEPPAYRDGYLRTTAAIAAATTATNPPTRLRLPVPDRS